MELQEFIKETLTQITKGVKEAQEELKDTGVVINPSGVNSESKGYKYLQTGGYRYVQDIEINVGLVATEKDGKKAGIGVFTGLLSGGVQANEDYSKQVVNNVKFSIPIALPTTETPKGNEHSTKMR